MRRPLPLLLPVLLAACSMLQPPAVRPGPYQEAPAQRPPVPVASGGGVFTLAAAAGLLSDSRAYRIGDTVTVLLQETTQASKSAGTKLGKDSALSVTPPTVLGKTPAKLGVELAANQSFQGDASSTQQNALSGAITVMVQDVLPNGLLYLAGEKVLTLNQGEEFVRLRGYVRAADIDTNNQVSSQRIANARIAYAGQGALADSNTPGWLVRFFASPLMPF